MNESCFSLRGIGGFLAGVFAIAMTGLLGCQDSTPATPHNPDEDGTDSPCPWDEDDEAASATALAEATPAEGFICPSGDQDWYRFSVPSGMGLLTVDLSLADYGSISPTYVVWDSAQTGVVAAPASTEAARDGDPLSITYGLGAGEYVMMVSDQGDGLDVRHPYSIGVTTAADKDTNEPNNAPGQATAGTGGRQGYISYRGDEDWYMVQAPERGILHVTFNMPPSGIVPTYRIEDASGKELIERSNDAGMQQATAFSFAEFLGDAGNYYVVISDYDNIRSDANVSYSLNLEVSSDPDTNEGNDEPSTATDLTGGTAINLTNEWTERTSSGYIASAGDVDWYQIDISTGGARGVIEADVAFATAGLPADMQADIRFMYGVPGEPCTEDSQCDVLSRTCERDIDCAMVGTACDINAGVCAGAGRCIDGNCGATLTSLTAPETSAAAVRLSAPLMEDISRIYAVVSDSNSDAYSASNSYNVTVRVATEPDANEPSEAYAGIPPTTDDDMSLHQAQAVTVPVHDCVAGDCCDGTTWVEGAISYTYDQDWYSYAHPCEGEDCMVAVHYELAAGPVDFLMMVTLGADRVWVELTSPSDQGGNNSAINNIYGGLTNTDECFFAHNLHGGYNLVIRDTAFISGGNPDGGTWDANRNQTYRFCIEKIADECAVPPCTTDDYGCFIPAQ